MTAVTQDLKTDRRIGWALFVGAFFVLLLTEKPAGFVRDESVYFSSAEQHAQWFKLAFTHPSQAFSDDAIVRFYDFNHEHPALMKNLFGLSHMIFTEWLGLLRPAASLRLPAFLFAALILPLIFAMAKPLFGRPAAIFAAISFLLVPRQFFEAHLSCFDVPIATMWLLVIYCYWRAQEGPSRWWLYTGISFGLALATKHNAWFLPAVLLPFSLWRGWKASASNRQARALFVQTNGIWVAAAFLFGVLLLALGPAKFQSQFLALSPHMAIFIAASIGSSILVLRLRTLSEETFRSIGPLVAMAVLGPVIFYLHWPYLWHHPVDRAAWYFAFHLTHNHYTWFYLGELLRAPPFPLAYVLVVTALTVPTAIFAPMVIGFIQVMVKAARLKATLLEGLIAINAIASIALISQPDVPHFGGVKHWFPSMPFLAILAGGAVIRGSDGLFAWLRTRVKSPAITAPRLFIAIAVLLSSSAVIASVRVYPYGTSFYSELSGGLPGGASLGMQRQFWANNVTGVLPWINQNARPGERVYLHECHGGQVRDYQRNGMLRTDLAFVNDPFSADIVAYQYHQEFREQEFNVWQAMGSATPVTGLYVDETPQVIVYRRK